MENPFHYRNKAQYPLGIDKNGEPVIGVFANRTHEVIPMQKCLIQNTQSEEIAKFVLQFIKDNNILIYNEKTGKGLFRHIVIKVGIKTNEIMCVLVVNGNQIPKESKLVSSLLQKFPNIKTIVKNIKVAKDLRVYLDAGDQDEGEFYKGCKILYQALTEQGIMCQNHIYPGHHCGEYIQSNLERYLEFYGN